MTRRGHFRLLAAATAVWVAFWIAGLPDYYRQYSTRALVAFELLLLVPVAAAGVRALRPRRPGTAMRRALALAFYFTVPLFLYDLAYCGLYLGYGLRFLVRYWYLTAYYVVPWVSLPLTALWLERGRRAGTDPSLRGARRSPGRPTAVYPPGGSS